MTENEMKDWLNRAFYADKKKAALEKLAKRHRERAEGFHGFGECNDRGKSDSSVNGTEDAFIRLADISLKLDREILELSIIEDEIREAISKLNDNDLEAVLINRYLNFMTIEETAEEMNYSVRAVYYKHNKAVRKLCTLLHCFARCSML